METQDEIGGSECGRLSRSWYVLQSSLFYLFFFRQSNKIDGGKTGWKHTSGRLLDLKLALGDEGGYGSGPGTDRPEKAAWCLLLAQTMDRRATSTGSGGMRWDGMELAIGTAVLSGCLSGLRRRDGRET